MTIRTGEIGQGSLVSCLRRKRTDGTWVELRAKILLDACRERSKSAGLISRLTISFFPPLFHPLHDSVRYLDMDVCLFILFQSTVPSLILVFFDSQISSKDCTIFSFNQPQMIPFNWKQYASFHPVSSSDYHLSAFFIFRLLRNLIANITKTLHAYQPLQISSQAPPTPLSV